MAGWIDQVDQESVAVGLLLDEGHVDVAQLVEKLEMIEKLVKVDFNLTEMAVDLMVMHRSCSSFRVSVNRVSPALLPAMIPALL